MREGAKIRVPFKLKLSAKLLRYRAINIRKESKRYTIYIYQFLVTLQQT